MVLGGSRCHGVGQGIAHTYNCAYLLECVFRWLRYTYGILFIVMVYAVNEADTTTNALNRNAMKQSSRIKTHVPFTSADPRYKKNCTKIHISKNNVPKLPSNQDKFTKIYRPYNAAASPGRQRGSLLPRSPPQTGE